MKIFKTIAAVGGCLLLTAALTAGAYWLQVTADAKLQPALLEKASQAACVLDGNGEEIADISLKSAARSVRLCHIPLCVQRAFLAAEDRKFYGLNLMASVEDNIVSVIEKKISRGGFYNKRKGKRCAEEMINKLNIKVTSPKQLTGNLSGGNQQKVVLAKWLLNDPDIIIFDEPTRGIDVGAKAEIYKIIEDLACDGKGIIVISSEMPELIGLSHRMIVLHEGEMTGTLERDELIQENIMTLASGYRKEEM